MGLQVGARSSNGTLVGLAVAFAGCVLAPPRVVDRAGIESATPRYEFTIDCGSTSDCVPQALEIFRTVATEKMGKPPILAIPESTHWPAFPDEVRLERSYQPSEILQASYCEKSSYLVRLGIDRLPYGAAPLPSPGPLRARVRLSFSVLLTLNCKSPGNSYRAPSDDELKKYTAALADVVLEIARTLCRRLPGNSRRCEDTLPIS